MREQEKTAKRKKQNLDKVLESAHGVKIKKPKAKQKNESNNCKKKNFGRRKIKID